MSLGWKLLLIASIVLAAAHLFQSDILFAISIFFSVIALFPKR